MNGLQCLEISNRVPLPCDNCQYYLVRGLSVPNYNQANTKLIKKSTSVMLKCVRAPSLTITYCQCLHWKVYLSKEFDDANANNQPTTKNNPNSAAFAKTFVELLHPSLL